MPQMMPLNWMMLMMYFIVLLIFMNTLLYFNFLYQIKNNNFNLIKKNSSKKSWKW